MYLYFIRACDQSGLLKIGIASDVERRLAELQTGNHIRLEIVAKTAVRSRKHAEHIERLMHKVLGPFRVRGEWFTQGKAVQAFLHAAQNAESIHDVKKISKTIQVSARRRAGRNARTLTVNER